MMGQPHGPKNRRRVATRSGHWRTMHGLHATEMPRQRPLCAHEPGRPVDLPPACCVRPSEEVGSKGEGRELRHGVAHGHAHFCPRAPSRRTAHGSCRSSAIHNSPARCRRPIPLAARPAGPSPRGARPPLRPWRPRPTRRRPRPIRSARTPVPRPWRRGRLTRPTGRRRPL